MFCVDIKDVDIDIDIDIIYILYQTNGIKLKKKLNQCLIHMIHPPYYLICKMNN